MLADYHINDSAKEVLLNAQLALLVGLTSSGRNTIIRELLKTGSYYYVRSDTTRPPRLNDGVLEQNGVEYFFRTEQEMLEEIRAGDLVEAAVIHEQQVSGVSIREIKKANELGKIAITDVEPVGLDNIRARKPNAVCLFILPPSFVEWQQRLQKRGNMSPQEYRRRLESAIWELEWALERPYYRYVINDSLTHAVEVTDRLIHDPDADHDEQEAAHNLAAVLLAETKEYINHL